MILLDPDLESDLSSRRSNGSAHSTHAAAEFPRNLRIPSTRTLARFLHEAQAAVKLRGEVVALLTTDGGIKRLNRQFRGKNKTTDVLSFPVDSPVRKSEGPGAPAPRGQEIAGDLAISVPAARRQAEELGHSLSIELKVLMLHGLLHLAGYDHETDNGTMARAEQKLRAKLRLPQGLIERANADAPSSAQSRRQRAQTSARMRRPSKKGAHA
jgi:probable rRNA maturation factor